MAEAAYGTAVGDPDLIRAGLFKGPDMGERIPEIITDEEQIGRGHDFPDSQVIHTWSSQMTRTWDASVFWVGWAFAFAMGTAAVAGAVDPWTHTLKFMDENVDGTQLPSATIIEEIVGVSSLLNRKYTGMCVNEVTLTASGKGRVQLTCSLVGNGQVAVNALAIPAITPADEYLRGSNVDMTVNAVNLKDYIKGWSLKISNNLMLDDGYVLGTAGDFGKFRERMFFGRRSVELALTILAPPTATLDFQALMEAGTNAPVVITCSTEDVNHDVTLNIDNYKFTATPKGSDNNQLIFNVAGNAFWTAADQGPLEVITNDAVDLAHLAAA